MFGQKYNPLISLKGKHSALPYLTVWCLKSDKDTTTAYIKSNPFKQIGCHNPDLRPVLLANGRSPPYLQINNQV